MPKIDLSAEEKRQLKKNVVYGGFSVTDLPSAEGQPFTWYHDPRTGREMHLPCDPINQRTYLMKGYRLGRSPGGELLQTTPQTEDALPANVQEIVNTAVQAALIAAGVIPAQPEAPIEPVQLALFD